MERGDEFLRLQERVADLEARLIKLGQKLTAQTVHPMADLLLDVPMRSACTLCMVLGLGLIFLLLLSGVFVGKRFFAFLASGYEQIYPVMGAGLALLLFLLLLDVQKWHLRPIFCGAGSFCQMLLIFLAMGALVIGALTAVEDYPSWPLAVMIAAFPLLAVVLKRCLLNEICACQSAEEHATQRMEESRSANPPRRCSTVMRMDARMGKNKLRRVGAFALLNRSFMLLSVLSFVVWAAWLAIQNAWAFNAHTRDLLGGNPRCAYDYMESIFYNRSFNETEDPRPACDTPEELDKDRATFLLWCSPLILCGMSIVNAIVFSLLGWQARAEHQREIKDDKDDEVHSASHAVQTMTLLGLGLVFLLWCAASIAGAGMKIAHDLMAIVGAATVALSLVVLLSVKRQSGDGLTRKISGAMAGEWVQAMLVFAGIFPLMVYLVFSFVRQILRLLGQGKCMCDSPYPEEEDKHSRASWADRSPNPSPPASPPSMPTLGAGGSGPSTSHFELSSTSEDMDAGDGPDTAWRKGGRPVEASQSPRTKMRLLDSSARIIINGVHGAQRKTQVLLKVHLLCYATWAMLFGSTLTFVALAALILFLKTLHYGIVIVLFMAIGIGMFLIPVVPGLAVYLTAGICIVQIFRDVFGGGDFGFYMAILLASGLCYVMKILAHILQQKIFGECCGKSVAIRSMVAVNSNVIKAIKFELSKPGFSLSKVCIMCGGPDWPTSVLCGILRVADKEAGIPPRVKTFELCLCLAPMILLIGPTVMAAAFQLQTGSPYAAIASVSLVLCTIIQVAAAAIATSYINGVLNDKTSKQLLAEENDQKVAEYDAKAQQKADIVAKYTTFGSKLWCHEKFLLVLSTVLLVLSSYALLFASSYCFEDFNLATDELSDVLCWDCPRAFVKLPGLLVLGMLAVGILCSNLFQQLVGCRIRVKAHTAQTGDVKVTMPDPRNTKTSCRSSVKKNHDEL